MLNPTKQATTIAVLLALSFAIPPVQAEADATVILVFDASDYPTIPFYKTCDVAVPQGSDGKAMLLQAVLDYCIYAFTGTVFVDLGFFVDSIDGRRAVCDTPVWLVHCTFWHLKVNGADSTTGVDGWSAQDGDEYTFTYNRDGAGLPPMVP